MLFWSLKKWTKSWKLLTLKDLPHVTTSHSQYSNPTHYLLNYSKRLSMNCDFALLTLNKRTTDIPQQWLTQQICRHVAILRQYRSKMLIYFANRKVMPSEAFNLSLERLLLDILNIFIKYNWIQLKTIAIMRQDCKFLRDSSVILLNFNKLLILL